jgi:hypothetical protein
VETISALPSRRPRRSWKAADLQKSSVAHVRLRSSEKHALEAKSRTLGERPSRVLRRLVREFVTGEADYFGSEVAELRRGCDELARIGNNLNQLVRLAHQGQWSANADLERTLESVLGVVNAMHGALSTSARRLVERRV